MNPPVAHSTSLPPFPPLRGIFVAGTDTGVGKTQVACAILRLARNLGRRPIPFKPAESGADPLPLDAHKLHEAAQPPVPKDQICLYPLPLPAAPQAAAERAGVRISTDRILSRARDLAAAGDSLVVEAAGGLLVPYAAGLTGADLAHLIGLPILLVARTALGTVNHTALSINEIRHRKLPLLGILLSQTTPAPLPHDDTNIPMIRHLTGIEPLGVMPYVTDASPANLADALVASLAPAALAKLMRPLLGDPPS
jgi:dethiobiotin synthetase